MDDVKEAIRRETAALGFDAVGFAAPETDGEDGRALARFLKLGRHGDMDWMARTEGRRRDPKALWPDVRSIIVLGISYAPASDPLISIGRRKHGTVSVYAQGTDYHRVVKKRLKRLARWIAKRHACEVKVFVDTAPVMEKPLAERGGIGWRGKHTNLVSRRFGSWLFLGEIFTSLAIPPDAPEVDHCGSCDRCRQACPTDALPEPYRIDPRRCISYLTIEHKGSIEPDLMERMGNRIFGCDDCLAVCPWNKFATPTPVPDFQPRIELAAPRLTDLVHLDDAGFRRVFSGSAIKRIGRDRLIRNVLIAIGNSGDLSLIPVVRRLRDDPSAVVARAARWAEKRLEGMSRPSHA